MKRFQPLLFAFLFSLHTAGAAEEPSKSAILDEQLAAAQKAVTERAAAVSQAIDEASKAGVLKPATAVYLRDLLSKFNDPFSALTNYPGAVSYPPDFDTSAEMLPLRKAWSALRDEVRQPSES